MVLSPVAAVTAGTSASADFDEPWHANSVLILAMLLKENVL